MQVPMMGTVYLSHAYNPGSTVGDITYLGTHGMYNYAWEPSLGLLQLVSET